MNAKRSEWDKIRDLYHKLLYWLYRRGNVQKALKYADQLEPLLDKADPNHGAILAEEIWSLISEAKGDLRNAIRHRENEIGAIRQLHTISRDQPYEKIATNGYDYSDLSDRLNLLAALYHDSGNLDGAIRTLSKSKQLCADHGIEFDADDVLEEYLAEKASS